MLKFSTPFGRYGKSHLSSPGCYVDHNCTAPLITAFFAPATFFSNSPAMSRIPGMSRPATIVQFPPLCLTLGVQLVNMTEGVHRSNAERTVPAADLEAHLFLSPICTPLSPAGCFSRTLRTGCSLDVAAANVRHDVRMSFRCMGIQLHFLLVLVVEP